ncbi:glycosyl transferase family 1 [Agromyces sp. Root1464]|uniref:glycosyltransferase n=1 Tax=Agromyces sp. Root1464 TaxID=1736467 RepID=UPI0006F3B0D6|nr:glycosyltransferase [Agromyces sp. Root1464]KQZ09224.1 glycosyl transferase family 1 [Agromyces sp. Root1464]
MRIGIIAPPWIPVPPPAYGGIESFIDTLARAIVRTGHDVVLAASGDSTSPVERLPGFPPSGSDTMGLTTHEMRHLIRAYAQLDDVDVIVDNTLAGPILARTAAMAPVVTIAHGPFIPLVQELYGAASPDMAFVAISHHHASTAGSVRIARVIHHGIRVTDVPMGPGGSSACFVGRMNPTKGVVEAIRVAERAGIPLRIAAKMREPAEQAYFAEAVRPLLGRNAEYIGELSTAETCALMGESCALVNPIQWDEPFGLVMIESLATGTPVVATPRGSVPELVDDGATGFVRSGIDELASALVDAAALDRTVCRARAQARFTDARMARDYLDLFADMLTADVPTAGALTADRPIRRTA